MHWIEQEIKVDERCNTRLRVYGINVGLRYSYLSEPNIRRVTRQGKSITTALPAYSAP